MIEEKELVRIKSKSFSELPAHESAVNLIFCDLDEIKTRFVFIGDKLREIQDLKYYEKFGYHDIVTFAEDVFGFSKSTTYSLININRMFCKGNSLLPQYKDFSKSQLDEMSSMLAWQTLPITSDFTVSDIRDYKKALGSGGFSYKGINFKNARQIIAAYRQDKESEKVVNIPDVGNNSQSLVAVKEYFDDTKGPTSGYCNLLKGVSAPSYIVQWVSADGVFTYGYNTLTEVEKVVSTFSSSTKYRVFKLPLTLELVKV